MRIITNYLVATIFVLAIAQPTLAEKIREAKPIEILYESQVQLNVANEAINRISFTNFVVTKLIGNISGFDSILSDSGSDLFIAPKLPEGKTIDFSALLSSGDVIDFSLNVVKSTTPYLVRLGFPNNGAGTSKSEATKMIEAMNKGINGKYYVQKSNKKISIPGNPEIKAVLEDCYRYGNLCGILLTLQSTNKSRAIEITPELLSKSFAGIVAIHMQQGLLQPNGKLKTYIVFKEGLE